MKLLVVVLLMLWPGIFKVGEWILSWTYLEEGDDVQVILYVVVDCCNVGVAKAFYQYYGDIPHHHEYRPILVD